MNAEISRADLLQWINETLKLQMTKIEQLGTGAVYCQLIDAVHPGKIALNKVNWKAKHDYEYVNNFKLLQQSFTKLGLTKPIEIEKLTKCKYQDNLEFLQWFRKYLDNHFIPKDYDPVSKRNNVDPEETEKPVRNASKPKSGIKNGQLNLSKNSSYATIQVMNGDQYHNRENKQPSVTDLLITIETIRNERDFFLQKLKDLDTFMEQATSQSNEQLQKGIREILYFTQDRSINILPNGELDISVDRSNEDQESMKDIIN